MGTGGLVLALAGGCGLRLESDAPDVPFVPREPYPGLAVLTAERSRCLAARDAAAAAPATRRVTVEVARAFAAAHAADLAALDARIAEVGDDRPTPSGTTPPAAPDFAGAEGADLHDEGLVTATVAALPGADLPVVLGARLTRAVAARSLDVAVPGAPKQPSVPPEVAARVLALVRPVMYRLEVAAAQAAPKRKDAATDTVAWVAIVRNHLEEIAGGAGTEPAGFRLPFPVASPADADRLAVAELGGLAADLVRACAAAPGDRVATATLAGWALEAQAWRARWGGAPHSAAPAATSTTPTGS